MYMPRGLRKVNKLGYHLPIYLFFYDLPKLIYYLPTTKIFFLIIIQKINDFILGKFLTKQMVHYSFVKMTNQLVGYSTSKKNHLGHNKHVKINLFKMMGWFI
jgi:hypothetical protein